MSSGVQASADCVSTYNDLKLSRKYKYIIYALSPDKKQIVVEKAVGPDASSNQDAFNEFAKNLPTDDCRYAVFDFEYEKEDGGGKRNRICFISWAPDTAPVKSKMVYASSKDALRKTLVGVSVEVQASDAGEISYESVLEKCDRFR